MTTEDVHPSNMFGDDTQLAAFGRDLREAAAATPAPVLGDELRLVLAEGLPGLADGSSLTPTPARRRARSRWVRAAVAGAVASITFAGLGVAGALPDAVQGPLSSVFPGVPDVADHETPPVTDAPPASTPPVELPEPAAERPEPPIDEPPAADPAQVPPHAGPAGEEPPGRSEELQRGRSADHVEQHAPADVPAAGPDGSRGTERADEVKEERENGRSHVASGDDDSVA